MLATDRGQMWLARWQRTTPSIRAAPTSSGSSTFSLDSMFCERTDNEHVRSLSSHKQRHVVVEQEVLVIISFLWNYSRWIPAPVPTPIRSLFSRKTRAYWGAGVGMWPLSVLIDALQCWMWVVCLFTLQPITEPLSDYSVGKTSPPNLLCCERSRWRGFPER